MVATAVIVIVVLVVLVGVGLGVYFGAFYNTSTEATPTVSITTTVAVEAPMVTTTSVSITPTVAVTGPPTYVATVVLPQTLLGTYPLPSTGTTAVTFPANTFTATPSVSPLVARTQLMSLTSTAVVSSVTKDGFQVKFDNVTQGGVSTTTPTVGNPVFGASTGNVTQAHSRNTNANSVAIVAVGPSSIPLLLWTNNNGGVANTSATGAFSCVLASNAAGTAWNTINNTTTVFPYQWNNYSGVAGGILSNGQPIFAMVVNANYINVVYGNSASSYNVGLDTTSTCVIAYSTTPNGGPTFDSATGNMSVFPYDDGSFAFAHYNGNNTGSVMFTRSTVPVNAVGGSALTPSNLTSFSLGTGINHVAGGHLTNSSNVRVPCFVGWASTTLRFYASNVAKPTSASDFAAPVTVYTGTTHQSADLQNNNRTRVLHMSIGGVLYPCVIWITLAGNVVLSVSADRNGQSNWSAPLIIDAGTAFGAIMVPTTQEVLIAYAATTGNTLRVARVTATIASNTVTPAFTSRQLGSQTVNLSTNLTPTISAVIGMGLVNGYPALSFATSASGQVYYVAGSNGNYTLDDSMSLTYSAVQPLS